MKWINIKDKQPEEEQEIVGATITTDFTDVEIGVAYFKNNIWKIEYGEASNEIHYWMPIEDLTNTLPK